MKKKTQSLESILARAEKLFDKGNYPLAKREFEKAGRMFERADIAEKIKICNKETEKLKAKDLVKRAMKHAKKNNLRKALGCYEEAYRISGDDWITEKIARLQEVLLGRDTGKAARDAEAAGQYLRAVELYEQTFTALKREEFLIKKARCLVKAERYGEAISVFQNLTLSDIGALYDYGFALAKLGRYYGCLKIWDDIASRDSGFLEQKEAVRSLLEEDIYRRFDRANDFASIYEEGGYLLNSTNRQGLDGLVEYCKYAWIEELWKEERYETIAGLLFHSPAKMEPTLLGLYAKICFKLAETSGAHLADLTMFWLTAVYSEIVGRCSSGAEDRAKIRRKLIRMAEDLIKKYADPGEDAAEKQVIGWNIEKKLVEDLYDLVGDREDLAHLVCTPQFAARFGKSDQVLRLIRDNRDFFGNTEHYLMTGSYYSPAGQSLYHLERGEYEKALASLPDTKDGDEFQNYGILRVKFAYGLYCLEQGFSRPGRYFETATALFDISSRYEREFKEKAFEVYEPDELRRYEEVLIDIHRKRPSKSIKEALSLVMSRRAIEEYNQDLMNSRNLEITLIKALTLNPENELARGTLNDLQVDLEIQELDKALIKFRMNKACKIAAESEYQEVLDYFFDFMEKCVEGLDEMGLTNKEKILRLNDLHGWCTRVDDSHSILYDIDRMLKQLEQR
ncbi:MAG: hypothetical protein JRG73_18870 [Deltaproteobacteria bacterium]|nr:hypothetical protein [Deltaproteobacteria bacterium]MBW2308990.1 hypothetical protein [Deltaproteobacteria bacterium]